MGVEDRGWAAWLWNIFKNTILKGEVTSTQKEGVKGPKRMSSHDQTIPF